MCGPVCASQLTSHCLAFYACKQTSHHGFRNTLSIPSIGCFQQLNAFLFYFICLLYSYFFQDLTKILFPLKNFSKPSSLSRTISNSLTHIITVLFLDFKGKLLDFNRAFISVFQIRLRVFVLSLYFPVIYTASR